MKPNQAIKYISNGMSLREPQRKSLEILSQYLGSPAGRLVIDRMKRNNHESISTILEESLIFFSSNSKTRGFQTFERSFPALTYALATGVGKTRLMGAFIAYLYLVHGVQHFLLVAPNLTIYRKLLDDFSRQSNPKYAFRGIQEININTTSIVTSENYASHQSSMLFGNKLEINIFNVQQFAQKDMTNERGITKAWESAAESYFDYLKSQKDLVVLLDEAHHYHADAAMNALELLDPMIGLELTATPYIATVKSTPIKMKNVVYEYNLGDAIRGGFVKNPWIGTEADVNFRDFDIESEASDRRKLQLAGYFHDRAKNALKKYSAENNQPEVKPVMLVVAKDTQHASELYKYINSDDFRGGEFIGKTIEVHTKKSKEESDENIELLLSLEDTDNPIEIVIHVNMLKEGWDVNNVYTIAPLRQSAAAILTEQTIGRGLRLPYGYLTGDTFVDRVMIVAHEQYSKIVEQAKDSVLIQGHVEKIEEDQIKEAKQFIEVPPVVVEEIYKQLLGNPEVQKDIVRLATEEIDSLPTSKIMTDVARELAVKNKTREMTLEAANEVNRAVFSGKKVASGPIKFEQDSLFGSQFGKAASDAINEIVKETNFELRYIPIPRVILQPNYEKVVIEDFDLNLNRLSYYATSATIQEESLQRKEETDLLNEKHLGSRDFEQTIVSSFGPNTKQKPENTIIAALMDKPLVDYEEQKPLLIKLTTQAVKHYRDKAVDSDNLQLMIETNAREISQEIYEQILEHKEFTGDGYLEASVANPHPQLVNFNYSQTDKNPVTLESQANTFSRDKTYTGFKKACHREYKFDSSDEVRLAYLLERDETVEDWLRPAPSQFEGLYWRDEEGDANNRYEPDFVVELDNEIVLVEVKADKDLENFSVQAKKDTAEKFCNILNANVGSYGIDKPWRYVIVSTENITIQSTIKNILCLESIRNKLL